MFVFAPHCLKMREREKKRKGSNQFVEIYKNKVNVNSSETHNKLIRFNALLNTIQTTYTVKILRAVVPLKNQVLSQNTQYIKHNTYITDSHSERQRNRIIRSCDRFIAI
jgi:hypothetical protein